MTQMFQDLHLKLWGVLQEHGANVGRDDDDDAQFVQRELCDTDTPVGSLCLKTSYRRAAAAFFLPVQSESCLYFVTEWEKYLQFETLEIYVTYIFVKATFSL